MARSMALSGALVLAALVLAGAAYRQVWIKEKIADARGADRGLRLRDPPDGGSDGRPVVLLLGDSRLARWQAPADHKAWRLLNRAIGGETVAQLAARFQAELQRVRPAHVVVSSGINDIVGISFLPPDEADAAIASLVGLFGRFAEQADLVGSELIITTILPPSRPDVLRRLAWPPKTIDLVHRTNDALRERKWPSRLKFIDLDRVFSLDQKGYLANEYRKNTLHLNEFGYAVYMTTILDTLDHRQKIN